MSPHREIDATPVFLNSGTRRIFAIYYGVRENAPSSRAVLYLSPFAEEMNRSRRMATLQARALAACGISVLLLDPYGTGDSEGDFSEARLHWWLDDVATAANWLKDKGHRSIDLWGLRFGALLAAAALKQDPARFSGCLLWQPVTSGRAMLTQFLRIAVAATMGDRDKRVSTNSLRSDLKAGRSVEVAGYEVAPELANDIDNLSLESFSPGDMMQIRWFEVGPDAPKELSAGGTALVDRWREQGVTVSAEKVAGPQFWSTSDITIAPALIEATIRSFAPVSR